MVFQVAHLLIELARFLMGLADWIEEKRGRIANRDNAPLMFEVFKIHCYGCDQPTGAYVGGKEGELLPPVYCSNCVEKEDEESEISDDGDQNDCQAEASIS